MSQGTTSPRPAPCSRARREKNSRGKPTSSLAGMTIRPMAEPVAVPPRKPARSIRRVFAPLRAAAMAAARPATPPPQTRTSTCAAMGTVRASSCNAFPTTSNNFILLNETFRDRSRFQPIGKPMTIRCDIGVARDAYMLAADGQEFLLVTRSQRLDDHPVFVARARQIVRLCNRDRTHDVGLLSVEIDRASELDIAAGPEERLMEVDIGAEGRLRVTLVDRHIVTPLSLNNPFDVVRSRASQHLAGGCKLQDFTDGINFFNTARGQSSDHCTAIRLALDETKALQPRQRLPDRVALCPKPLDQSVFEEPLSR